MQSMEGLLRKKEYQTPIWEGPLWQQKQHPHELPMGPLQHSRIFGLIRPKKPPAITQA